MALTFTKRISMPMGSKAFRLYDVTHDGSETSMDASDFELNYIDGAAAMTGTMPLSATSAAFTDLTTNNGEYLAFTALTSGAITTIMAIGF